MKLITALLLTCTFTSTLAQVTNPTKTENSAPKTTQIAKPASTTLQPKNPPPLVQNPPSSLTPDQRAILQKAQEIREKLLTVQKKLEGLDEFQLYQAYEQQLNGLQQAYDAATPKTETKK